MKHASKIFLVAVAVTVALLLVSRKVHAGDDAPRSQVVADSHHKFEVSVDPKKNTVTVSALHLGGAPAPRKMEITLYSDPETKQTLELSALNTQDPLPSYQGKLALPMASFVGVELRFRTGMTAVTVLRSVPAIPGPVGNPLGR